MAANPLATAAGRANIAGQVAVPGQARPRMGIQAPPSAMAGVQAHLANGLVPPLSMNGVPQAPMQDMQASHRMQVANAQPDPARLLMQARLIQNQQRQLQQQVAHHQQPGPPSKHPQPPPGGQSSPPMGSHAAVNGINQQSFMANAQAMMAPFNGAGGAGMGTPGAGVLNMPSVAAGSPRMNTAQAQQLSPAMLAQQQLSPAVLAQLRELEAGFRAKNPSLSPEQTQKMALNGLQQILLAGRQNAMASAAGGSAQQSLLNGMTSTSPHQYAQVLRAQALQAQANAHAQAIHAQAQAQAQGQSVAGQQSTPHQRQPSSGATPMPKG